MKRVNILNLECFISERNVIKKILSYLNEVDVELILCAYNARRPIPSCMYYLKKYAKYGYTDLLLLFIDNLDFFQRNPLVEAAAEGGHETFNILIKKFKMKITTYHYSLMSRGGHLELLKSINPFRLEREVCIYAAEGGQLNVLKYLRSVHCLWDERTCTAAAKQGHLKTLKWAVENGCPWNNQVTIWATYNGDLNMLSWAIGSGCDYNAYEMANIATKHGYIHILQWIKTHIEKGTDYIDQNTILDVVRKGNLDLLKWLFVNCGNYEHKKRFCTIAAKRGYLEMLRWLRRRGCPWNGKKVCILLARQGCTGTLVWAKDNEGVWSKECYEEALKNKHLETATMLLQNGLKTSLY